MIGRGASNNPMMLWDVDRSLYGEPAPSAPPTRRGILEAYRSYLEEKYPPGEERPVGCLHLALKPTLGALCGMRGNRVLRGSIDANLRIQEERTLGPAHILAEALRAVEANSPGALDEPLRVTSAYTEQAAAAALAVAQAAAAAQVGDVPLKGKKRRDRIAIAAAQPAKVCKVQGADADPAEQVKVG
mmetsp:Transcript_91885/g.255864  ORF Transcript_91885/g.255864 Transcript_91885/m.255864 type:complete len:187 (-) Transcript_91885:80-640(-)